MEGVAVCLEPVADPGIEVSEWPDVMAVEELATELPDGLNVTDADDSLVNDLELVAELEIEVPD